MALANKLFEASTSIQAIFPLDWCDVELIPDWLEEWLDDPDYFEIIKKAIGIKDDVNAGSPSPADKLDWLQNSGYKGFLIFCVTEKFVRQGESCMSTGAMVSTVIYSKDLMHVATDIGLSFLRFNQISSCENPNRNEA